MFEPGVFKLLVWVAWGGAIAWLLTALVTLLGLARNKPLKPLAQSEELMRASAPAVSILGALSRRFKIPIVYALSSPLGLAVLYSMLFDSAIRIVSGKGVTWKGRKVYERTGSVRPPAR
jgi:hypothetical protein